jgi:hypothetical protein
MDSDNSRSFDLVMRGRPFFLPPRRNPAPLPAQPGPPACRRPTEDDRRAPPIISFPAPHPAPLAEPDLSPTRRPCRAVPVPWARTPGRPRCLFKGAASPTSPSPTLDVARPEPSPRNPSRPPLQSASSLPFHRREDRQPNRVEVRSTLVRFVHILAFRSTRTCSPDLRRRRRLPSAVLCRRRCPGSSPLGSP